MLPHTIENVTALIQGCIDEDMARHLQHAVTDMKQAKDTMCRSQQQCQLTAAKKCVSEFQANPTCRSVVMFYPTTGVS